MTDIGDDDDDDRDWPAYSHHDKIPPWWGNVSNDKGQVSDKIPPYMKNIIGSIYVSKYPI